MSSALKRLIEKRYQPPEWAVVTELRDGVGWSAGSHAGYGGAIDSAAFNCWPSKGWHRLAFECKAARGDFFRELEKPEKRRWVEENFHQTWFVVAPGVCKDDEVPEGWGLLVATKDYSKLIRRKAAMHRETGPMPEALALSAIRALAQTIAGAERRHYFFEGMWLRQEQVDEVVRTELADGLERIGERKHELDRKVLKLDDERKLLYGPLLELAEIAGGWSLKRDVGSGRVPVTVEQVREWRDEAVRQALRKAVREAVGARNALDAMLKRLDVDPDSMERH